MNPPHPKIRFPNPAFGNAWDLFGDPLGAFPLPKLDFSKPESKPFELKLNPLYDFDQFKFKLGPIWTYPWTGGKLFQDFKFVDPPLADYDPSKTYDFRKGFSGITWDKNYVAMPVTDFEGNTISEQDRWIRFLVGAFNNIKSLDLDYYNLPANRGSNLCRFSEYSPKDETVHDCNIKIQSNTTVRGHGEIRPIKGMNESWITRVVLDFQPNVFYSKGALPFLEIDGFTAVDPPIMKFDYSKGRKSVLSMDGGNYSYENPQVSGEALATPFDGETDAPPGGHNYWMFRFNPLATNLVAGFMEKTSDDSTPVKLGVGALLLWAFMPTFGISKEETFKNAGIPFNTLPRKFGDLIQLLSPLFEKERGAALRLAAPFYNPNNEYLAPNIDENGMLVATPEKWRDIQKLNEDRAKQCEETKKAGTGTCLMPVGRQPIPEDPNEVDKINKELVKVGLPPIPRKRGTILDWIFSDIAKDPERLKKMPSKPSADLHLRMRPTTLDLPFGKIKIDSSSDIQVHFQITPVENPTTHATETRVGIRIDIVPMNFQDVGLNFNGAHVRADKLNAKKLIIDIPSIPGMGTEDPANRPPWGFSLEGVSAEGLKFSDDKSETSFGMDSGGIEKISFSNRGDNLQIGLEKISGKGLSVDNPVGHFSGTEFDIPKVGVSVTYEEREVKEAGKDPVKKKEQRFLSVTIPEINSKIGLNFKHKDSGTEVGLQGSTSLKGISFYQETQEKNVIGSFKMDVSGNVDSATVKNPDYGDAKFTTKQGEKINSPITGHFESTSVKPREPKDAPGKTSFDLDFNLPYVGFESNGLVTIPAGSSSLQNTHLKVHKDGQLTMSVEGHMDLHKASHKSERPSVFGNFSVLPNIQDLELVGDFKIDLSPEGFRLSPPDASKDPLKLHFKMDGSNIAHRPDLSGTAIGKIPESSAIQTDVGIDSATVDLQGLRLIEFKPVEIDGKKANKLTQLDAGPVTIHHLQGKGSIWVNLFIWGFVRGLFPVIGGSPTKTKRPDPAPLTAHLPTDERKALRDMLGDGDFFRLGEVKSTLDPSGEWSWHLGELLLNMHEEGGRQQYGMLRIPDLNFRNQKGKAPWDLGAGKFLINIFLNDPERGGSFYIDRWPTK